MRDFKPYTFLSSEGLGKVRYFKEKRNLQMEAPPRK
jgi:hypothetical protein